MEYVKEGRYFLISCFPSENPCAGNSFWTLKNSWSWYSLLMPYFLIFLLKISAWQKCLVPVKCALHNVSISKSSVSPVSSFSYFFMRSKSKWKIQPNDAKKKCTTAIEILKGRIFAWVKRDGPFARKEAGLTQTAPEKGQGRYFLPDNGSGDGGMHTLLCHRKKGLATTETTEY